LGCGHTAIGLPTKEDNYIDRFFPFKLKFLNGKAFIIEADEGNEPLIGAEVLKINEVPIKTVIHKLFRYITTDGINEFNKYMWLDSKFDSYYGLHIAQPASFNFSIKTKSGHDSLITVPALRKRLVGSGNISFKNQSPKHPLPFYLNLDNPKVAILTIDKFYVDENFDEKIYTAFADSDLKCNFVVESELDWR
jgi:hypothetical protein